MKNKVFFHFLFSLTIFTGLSFGQGPSDVATSPTADAANVVSIYSDSYTDIITNANPGWGQSGAVDAAFDPLGDGSNSVLAMTNFNFQGMEVTATDLSAMEFLHVDVWVAAGTDRMLKVTPINNGDGATEFLVEVPLTPGAWNSVDLPKSAFTGMTWNSVFQMKFDGQFNADGSANATGWDVYLDNVYFYRTVSTSLTPTDVAASPTVDAANVISVYSDSYTDVATLYNPGWSQSGTVDEVFDPLGDGSNYVLAYNNMNYQGTILTSGTDASAMEHLHIDIWVPVGQDEMIKVTPINDGNGGTGAGEFLVEVPVTPGAWNSVDLPKSAFTGMTWDNLHQMKFERFNADGSTGGDNVDIYLDNIYFWNDPTILSNEDESFSIIPEVFSSKAYPNPFNPYVNISYELPNLENVTVNIVNLLGQNVKTLVNSIHSPGSYTYTWNGKDEKGLDVNSGMYFAIINYESGRSILKITYLK